MKPDADGDGYTTPDEHLMRVGYALDRDDSCITDARRHAAAFLDRASAEQHLPVSARAKDLTALVVSELVTNTRKYAPGPVLLELRITARAVEVTVWDSDPTMPAARAADPNRVGQHGLEIVKAVAEDFAMQRAPVGKRITARIPLADGPGRDF
ncbi:ATP-binding protein [Streptomyces sp. NPDC006265]|uniref:ATP-binding protein n=1 Tax=Streptomyces sp. NPDC006265 TaxID=3156740 RepID=UPI0033A18F63